MYIIGSGPLPSSPKPRNKKGQGRKPRFGRKPRSLPTCARKARVSVADPTSPLPGRPPPSGGCAAPPAARTSPSARAGARPAGRRARGTAPHSPRPARPASRPGRPHLVRCRARRLPRPSAVRDSTGRSPCRSRSRPPARPLCSVPVHAFGADPTLYCLAGLSPMHRLHL